MRSLLTFLCAFLCCSVSLFAQDSAPVRPEDQGFTQMIVMLSIALVFFYLILWRPEQKRRKELEEQRNSLKKGDRVTAMGIIGTVSKINEDTVVLKMIDGAKVEFLRAAISDVQGGSGSEGSKKVELTQS